MINQYWILGVALWLLLGLIADKICELYSKKESEPYNKPVMIVAYMFGPIILPIALIFTLIKNIHRFLK